jgi:hypothetical protein
MNMPSYARMMAAEGLDDPAELGLIGDEQHVGARIDELAAVGVTELLANVVGAPEEQERTVALLGGAAR